jgi:sulfide:quinone oxidoreductase
MEADMMSPTTAPAAQRPASRPGSGAHHRVVIIGGGTAGITVAARLGRAGVTDIAILEPSEQHWYQPLWTLVGGGIVDIRETVRLEARVMPKDAHWIKARAAEIDPEAKTVTTEEGQRIGYDFLVVAPGIQLDWDEIPGLREALRTDFVSSNYDPKLAPKTFRMLDEFKGGNAIFTSPGTPLKCGGAPQKIMYLAADLFKRRGMLDQAHIVFGNAGKVIFGVEPFKTFLLGVVERYGIEAQHRHDLCEIRPDKREAVFRVTQEDSEEVSYETMPYDVMHVTPPQSAPDFIKNSALAEEGPYGFVDVDKHTLQHTRYPEVFALGDAGNTPNAKTGAAVRKQAPVVVDGLLAVIAGREPQPAYDGYGSCPLITAHNRMLLAEFDYNNTPTPSIPLINTGKERYSMYLLKRYGLPWLYWNLMLKGRA